MPVVLEELHKGGCGFDCASLAELQSVRTFVSRSDGIIYANPCKSRRELLDAEYDGMTTFDSRFELAKIHEVAPLAKPILRIFVDDKGASRIPLNKKFGFHIRNIHDLEYVEPPIPIYGLAFHVGSDCTSTVAYQSAFDTVRAFLDRFSRYPNAFRPEVLDIGGGFSGSSKRDDFFRNELAPLIRREVELLSEFKTVIAEPGRFFAEESCSLRVPVIGRKILPDGTPSITIDESVYGIFSGVLFDGFKPDFKCVTRKPYTSTVKYTIFGRTCDSADIIAENVWLPKEIDDSDILEVRDIGAYSWVSMSKFNGFEKPSVLHV
jgi:ornithine decarboxylase